MPSVTRYLLFNKPFRVLCQFSPEGEKQTLADYISAREVYPAGRLDFDSEGMLLLTNDGALQHALTDPKFRHPRTYWVQVEGLPDSDALEKLSKGVVLGGKRTLPCKAAVIEEPAVPPRQPPVRFRTRIPTSWLRLTLHEGLNRQVRHMTAAVGFPTLRLIRAAIGELTLDGLPVGQWRHLTKAEVQGLRGVNSRSDK
jgi:23S rRNA pseudouridine2457 synthase